MPHKKPYPVPQGITRDTLVSGELYPEEMVPTDFIEAKTEGEDLEEDLACDMILALMAKW